MVCNGGQRRGEKHGFRKEHVGVCINVQGVVCHFENNAESYMSRWIQLSCLYARYEVGVSRDLAQILEIGGKSKPGSL